MKAVSPEWLREQYWDKKRTLASIAEECGCSITWVYVLMKRHLIPRRDSRSARLDRMGFKPHHSREQLFDLYVRQNLSIYQVATVCGVGFEAIRRALKKFGIPRRPPVLGVDGRSNAWKGGRVAEPEGYIRVWNGLGYSYEHRLVVEEALGRPLTSTEVVHHVNRIKRDNRPENLSVLPSQSEHVQNHFREARVNANQGA